MIKQSRTTLIYPRLALAFGVGLWLGSLSPVAGDPPATNPVSVAKSPTGVTTNALPEQLTVDLGDGVKLECILIRPGTFAMGSLRFEPPARTVTLTKPFYIGKYEVTQAQWAAVMNENRSEFKDPQRPVENVSWEDCQKFLATLNARDAGPRFALPTEAQWEYCCRAGSTNEYCGSDTEDALESCAWYQKNTTKTTQPVGGKAPNAWGLHDMLGNVWEWCDDWWDNSAENDEVDPLGPKTGWLRVLRGGSWYNYASGCRATNRGYYEPTARNSYSGFRVVVAIP